MIFKKMGNRFDLPLTVTSGGVMPFLNNANGRLICVAEKDNAEALMLAVNGHDKMRELLKDLAKANPTDNASHQLYWLSESAKGFFTKEDLL